MIKPSQPETHQISHRWTIDAFTHKMAQQNRYFSSSTFTSSPTSTSSSSSSPHFKLRVYPNGPTDDLKDYMSVGLSLLSNGFEQQKLLVLCQVSLIDIEGQNQNTKERLCYFYSEKICCVIGKFINKINLLESQFVCDDKLTIDCQITILGEPSSVGFSACLPVLNSIAESKPCLNVKLFRQFAQRYQKNELPDFAPLDLTTSHNLLEETITHHHAASSLTFESSIGDEEYSPVFCPDSNPDLKFQFKWEISPGESFLSMSITYLSTPNIFVDCTVISKEICWHTKKRKYLRQKHFLREFSEDSNEIKIECGIRPKYREEVHISLNMTIYQGFSKKLDFPELNFNLMSRQQLLLDLKSMFEGGKHCDVVLLVEGKQFRAHKTILAAQSPVFEAMFSHDMKEKIENRVEMFDVKVQVFEQFLFYLCMGKVDFKSLKAHALDLFVLADMHFHSILAQMCLRVFSQILTPESVYEQFELADRFGLTEFKQVCVDYMNKVN